MHCMYMLNSSDGRCTVTVRDRHDDKLPFNNSIGSKPQSITYMYFIFKMHIINRKTNIAYNQISWNNCNRSCKKVFIFSSDLMGASSVNVGTTRTFCPKGPPANAIVKKDYTLINLTKRTPSSVAAGDTCHLLPCLEGAVSVSKPADLG